MDQQRIEDQVLRVTVEEAITGRLHDRRWYRSQRGYEQYYRDLSHENDVRLRELLRIRRLARRIAAPIVEREDVFTAWKAIRDIDLDAKADHFAGMEHLPSSGYGLDNVEGDPAFNGSFR